VKPTWNSLFRKHDLSGDQGERFGTLIIAISELSVNDILQQLKKTKNCLCFHAPYHGDVEGEGDTGPRFLSRIEQSEEGNTSMSSRQDAAGS
jgi:hypothetical protein